MQKITPFLWFDHEAEEAVEFYVSLFKNSRITNVSRYGDAGPGPKGQAMSITFELEGQGFMALNGGPVFTFNPAISLFVDCADQAEVDSLWNKLSEGGEPGQCGWIKDRFGLSWQIVPRILGELLGNPDPVIAQRVMAEMLTMGKLDIARLASARDKK